MSKKKKNAKTEIVIKWEPSSEGGTEIFSAEELGCETVEDFEELDSAEQEARMHTAIAERNQTSWLLHPYATSHETR